MIVRRLQLHGIGVHADCVHEFDRGLTAVVGPNGAGKTTLLESIYGVLYRRMPSRPLIDLATGTDSYIAMSGTLLDGREYEARLELSATSRSMRGFLRIDGVDYGGALAAYDEAVRAHFGAPEVVLASAFSPQQQRVFLDARPADRKAILAQILGLDRFEEKRAVASSRVTGMRDAVTAASAKVQQLEGMLADYPEDLDEQIEAAAQTVRDAQAALECARAEVATAAAEVERATEARNAAEAELQRLRAEDERARQEYQRLRSDLEARRYAAQRRFEASERALRVAGGRAQRAESALSELERVRPLVEERARLEAELAALEKARREYGEWEARVEALRRRASEAAELLAGLADEPEADTAPPPCVPVDPALLSGCQLAEGYRRQVELSARRREDLRRRAEEAERELNKVVAEEPEKPAGDGAEMAARIEQLPSPVDLARLEQQADGVEEARQQCSEASEALAEAKRDLDRIALDLAQLVEPPLIDTSDAERAVTEAQRALAAARLRHSRAEEAVRIAERWARVAASSESALRATAKERDKVSARHAAALAKRIEAADALETWTVLERAYSQRGGIPAVLLESTLEAIGDTATELLQGCLGSGWSVGLASTRATRSGTQKETLDVLVSRDGVTLPAENLSGGERVLVSEALGLALAIVQRRRCGAGWQALVRDESAGALDPVRARAYVDMLRRAMVQGEFAQLLYVSHQHDVWERADRIVRVEAP